MRWLLSIALLACACGTKATPQPERPVKKKAPTAPTEPVAVTKPALDRTLHDCEFSLLVFWDEHMLRVHRDMAMAVMGSRAIYSRVDYDLRWTGTDTFEAAPRHIEFPNGQAAAQELSDPFETYRYEVDGEKLTITNAAWDEPLKCTRQKYDDEFVRWMDTRYAR